MVINELCANHQPHSSHRLVLSDLHHVITALNYGLARTEIL